MSENKYIIDKDSLTGIADAVRDKLGVGQATTDPQTGDIVYPEDKGYYLKEGLIAKFNMGDCLIQGSHYSEGEATYLIVGSASDSTEYNVYFQKPFYSATLSFTLYGYTGRTNYLSVNGVSSESINYNATKKFTFSTPQSYLIIKSDMSSAYGSDTYIYQNLTVTLFDQNGNNIGVKTTSIKSYDFLTAPVPEKIPFSIDDIQDKITNYLGKSSSSLIDYEGLGYGYVSKGGSSFYPSNSKVYFSTFIPLNAGQKIGFCIGETVSNRLRAGFFSGKTYNNFSRYVENSSSSSTPIYSDGIGISGSTELSGDGLLKRFYYTAPSDGVLVVTTSNESKLAYLHVWEVTK